MSIDLENRIRASLRDRADDVEPTPELWQAVTRRTTRHRAMPYLGWTAAGTAVVLIGATIVPNLLDDTERSLTVAPLSEAPPAVEGEPGPDAEPRRSSGAAGTDPFLAVATDGRILLGTADGRVDLTDAPAVEGDLVPVDVSVRPGSTPEDVTAAVLYATEAGPELGWLRVVGGEVTSERFDDRYQVGFDADLGHLQVPVWSPDGRHLAWVERASDASWRLRTIGWDGGPGTGQDTDDNATTWLQVSADDLVLADWVWDERSASSPDATGRLLFAADRDATEASPTAVQLPIERQADGALAFGAAPEPIRDTGDRIVDLDAEEGTTDLLTRRVDGSFAYESASGVSYDVPFPSSHTASRLDLDAVGDGVVVTSRDTGESYFLRRDDGQTTPLGTPKTDGLRSYDHVD